MFQIPLNYLLDDAQKLIIKERKQYDFIYKIIEKYVKNNNILLGGDHSIYLLSEEDKIKEELFLAQFEYSLYTEDAFYHANNLSNIIASQLTLSSQKSKIFTNRQESRTIVILKTQIAYQTYLIQIDGRNIIYLYNLREYKGVKPVDIIKPIKLKSSPAQKQKNDKKNNNFLLISPEMHLIEIYRDLYSPHKAGEWDIRLIEEKSLYQLLKQKDIANTDLSVQGGWSRQDIESALLDQFVSKYPVILIGEHACKILIDHKPQIPVIQIISTRSVEEDFEIIKKIIHSIDPNIPVLKFTNNLHIMNDFRVKRTTVKIKTSEGARDVMYIYNSAQYDLVPFSDVNQFNIGNPFVILRFLLIDIWILRWIRGIGNIDEKFAQLRTNSILELFTNLHQHITDPENNVREDLITSESPLGVFQRENYLGELNLEEIARKEFKIKMPKHYTDYLPQLYKIQQNHYRELTKK